jgi:hypothetical protein
VTRRTTREKPGLWRWCIHLPAQRYVFLDSSWLWANLTHPSLRTRRLDQPEDDDNDNEDDEDVVVVGPTRRRTARRR